MRAFLNRATDMIFAICRPLPQPSKPFSVSFRSIPSHQLFTALLVPALSLLSCTLFFFSLPGCATRSSTPPRSTIIEQAKEKGIAIRTVEQDLSRYNALVAENNMRLQSLIQGRTGGNSLERSYRLGAGDQIEINVFDVPELNLTTEVRQTGVVSLPLVGAVPAEGLTEAEFLSQLTERLTTFVRNPQISVAVTSYASQLVSVMGAVRTPGAIPLKRGGNNLLDLLARAGGVNEKAGTVLYLVPGAASTQVGGGPIGESEGLEIALDQVLGTQGGFPLTVPVQGGDMIVIPEAGRILVEGEVVRPGSFELNQQMTFLGALAAASGITYSAKVDEVELVRHISPTEKVHLVYDLEKIARGEEKDIRLKNGDIVRIPSDSSRRLRQDTWETISGVINFGVGGQYNVAN